MKPGTKGDEEDITWFARFDMSMNQKVSCPAKDQDGSESQNEFIWNALTL